MQRQQKFTAAYDKLTLILFTEDCWTRWCVRVVCLTRCHRKRARVVVELCNRATMSKIYTDLFNERLQLQNVKSFAEGAQLIALKLNLRLGQICWS